MSISPSQSGGLKRLADAAGRYTYAIGIDPGAETGIAIWNRVEKRFEKIESLDFWSAFAYIVNTFDVKDCRLFIELTKGVPVYNRYRGEGNQAMVLKIAMNAGGVVRESELLIEGFRQAGFEVVECPAVNKQNQEQFKRLTGWAARTNQHERDSGVLVHKR